MISVCVCVCRVLKGARWSVLGECVAMYSGRLVVARSFIASSRGSIVLQSCSADVVFTLGTWYLYLRLVQY